MRSINHTAARLANVTSPLNDLAPLPLAQHPLKKEKNHTRSLNPSLLSTRTGTYRVGYRVCVFIFLV
jgi:hypothetical protein